MKGYVFGVAAAVVLSLIGLVVIVLNASPETASLGVKVLFFGSLFLLLWGILTLKVFWVKSMLAQRHKRILRELDFQRSAAIGFVLAFVVVGFLIFRRLF
jgi:hypothetical protein